VPKLLRHRSTETLPATFPERIQRLREAAEARNEAAIRECLWQAIALDKPAAPSGA
jgi:hypothetical protein